jgi:YafQ family addiction module toxin component
MYILDIKPEVDNKFKKISKKNPKQLNLIFKKIDQILKNPQHFKPLKGNMKNIRRTHAGKSFVLTFEINKNKKIVTLLDYEHHDKIY